MKAGNIKFIVITALLFIIIFMLVTDRKNNDNDTIIKESKVEATTSDENKKENDYKTSRSIDALTSESIVVAYLQKNNKLPDYYITKKEAREKGWIASEGNLCDVLPGKAIGGDIFTNREKKLPAQKGRKWYEADLNYNCGRRNADRVVFSNDGLIYVTNNHYKTFERK